MGLAANIKSSNVSKEIYELLRFMDTFGNILHGETNVLKKLRSTDLNILVCIDATPSMLEPVNGFSNLKRIDVAKYITEIIDNTNRYVLVTGINDRLVVANQLSDITLACSSTKPLPYNSIFGFVSQYRLPVDLILVLGQTNWDPIEITKIPSIYCFLDNSKMEPIETNNNLQVGFNAEFINNYYTFADRIKK